MLGSIAMLLISANPTDLTFVRHGETIANATGRYNSRTLNTFSEKGKAGVAALTQRLIAQPRYDLILVSPSERALRTVAPYLKATNQRATVWPLLYECCTSRRKKGPTPKTLPYGAKFVIPKDIAPLFVIEPGRDRLPAAPEYAAGLVQIQDTLREFRKLYVGKRLLVVGHSGHGGHFIHGLTGKWKHVENTKEIRVRL